MADSVPHTDMRNVEFLPISTVVQVLHPVLAQGLTLRMRLVTRRREQIGDCTDDIDNSPPRRRRKVRDVAIAGVSTGSDKLNDRSTLTSLTRSRAGLSNTVVVFRIPCGA